MDVCKIVPEDAAPIRLDVFITRLFKYHSRAAWQKKITRGEILLNGQPAKPKASLRPGDRIVYLFPPGREPPIDPNYSIIHQDRDILLVKKSGDIPTHAVGKYRTNNLRFLVKRDLGLDFLAPANRLDRETSGLVLFCLNSAAAGNLSRQFMARLVEKIYQAVVFGVIPEDTFSVNAPVGDDRESNIRIKRAVNLETGSPSLTRFKVLQRFRNYTLVECYPRTGRTNQIRIHLEYCGHPIVGDKMFVDHGKPFLQFIKKGMYPELLFQLKMPRQALHAGGIGFTHPTTEKHVRFIAPLPPDMVEFLEGLES
jgi:RluA family pseudouridine synthase